MIKLEITPYEQSDILKVLEFAKTEYILQSYKEEKGMSKYWINRIEELKRAVQGKTNPPSMTKGVSKWINL